jgi:phosphohistidine swiveling domain-containing protein
VSEPPRFDPGERWDNLNCPSRAGTHWSTDNVGEAAPGVLSPLGASIWGEIGERSTRGTFVAVGAMTRDELVVPEPLEDRVVSIFYGRVAMQVELLTALGDRLPGTSGQDMAASLFGSVPDDIEYHPTIRYYPKIAWKLSRTFFGMPGRLRTEPPQFHRWWQRSIAQLARADLAAARASLADALAQFEAALLLQSISVVGHAQIMYEALNAMIDQAGVGDFGVLSGSGGAEMAVIADIWRASQGELTIDQLVAEHGFHGPLEGEVSSAVWREDPRPLERMIDEYARREDPRVREAQKRAELPAAQAELLAALPRWRRPAAKLILSMAATRIPMRGVAKRSFLQGIDVIRCCARRIGSELVATGDLDDAEDAFYLTIEELQRLPADARERVTRRRERRAQYQLLSIPGAWKGLPEPALIEPAAASSLRVSAVQGIGVSGGIREGIARVVTDPSFADVEPDEILVAPTTDPSWASIMFLSAALVVDMGGPISHAAVVARELGLPCVVNTRSGTREIRTGDRLRVNGDTGTVEILQPAGAPGMTASARTVSP